MSADFIHLHVHTTFSLLDGAIRLKDLFAKAKADEMDAVAVTDHGNMYGVVQFYQYARNNGIKPLIGCEIYLAHGRRQDLSSNQPSPNHLVLIAENEVGYRNLLRMVTAAHLEGTTPGIFGRPRCDKELLTAHSAGLIALSACLHGEIARTLLENGLDKAIEAADWYRQIFPDRFYLELMRNGLKEQDQVNEGLLKIAKKLKLPFVATNDCHYLNKEHAKSHEILLCIQTGKTMKDENRFQFSTDQLFFRTKREMAELFADLPQALSRTKEIAERVDLKIQFGNFAFPSFDLPPGESPADAIAKEAHRGLVERLGEIKAQYPEKTEELWTAVEQRYRERLDQEITLINQKGFAGYFLIVQDFIRWAKNHRIPVGPGRGSAAGSLVSYSLNITDIDPLRYDLLFERFLNPERRDNPDIDTDFCTERRDEVIDYLVQRFGRRHVAQVAAFGNLRARAVVKDVGRALGYSYGEVEVIAKLIPDELGVTLDRAEKDPDLARLLKESSWVRELWFHAKALEGMARHISTHAGGIVITDQPLEDFLPLTLDKDGKIITQWDKNDIEKAGLIKFDLLGLKTLTVIDKAIRIIAEVYGTEINISRIPMDDPKVFDLLGKGLSTGVFQFESSGMRDLLVRIHPDSVEDLTAIAALYRPGPIQSGMIDDFIANKKGLQSISYPLPELEPILKSTYGMMVYQEQVQQVAHVIGGMSLGEADLMRRAMARKKPEEMASFQEKFRDGARPRGYPLDKIEKIWSQMEKFAEYGFNKSHSAAYAVVAYQTAWLKTNYPAPFMAALMTMDKENSDKIITEITECRDLSLKVLPPDVNESEMDFSVTRNGEIRFGMAAVKNVGEGSVAGILDARKTGGMFKGLYDFTSRVDARKVNKRVLESLIKCGAFDSLQANRAALLAVVEQALEQAAREQADRQAGQTSMFGLLGQGAAKTTEPPLPEVTPWSHEEMLRHEKDALGFFITGHPLDQFLSLVDRFATCDGEKLRERKTPDEVRLAAVITSLDKKTTKTGRIMAVGRAEDQKSSFHITIFSEPLERCRECLENLEQPFLLFGRVDVRDGGNGLLVDRIIPLEKADKVCSNEVHLKVRSSGLAKDQLERLKACMERHPGPCRAFIHMLIADRGEAVFALPPRQGLQVSDDLAEEVRAIFGPGAITFQ